MTKELKKIENKQNLVHAGTSEQFENLRVEKAKKTAAGLSSVIASMKFGIGEMGVLRATKTLSKLNQHGGIDCQSCAWADPDDERKFAEFCENGVKAISDEATRKLVTKSFFAENSVAELSERSDYWLNKQGRLTEPMFLDENDSHYKPISWNDAFKTIANDLNSLNSPDEAIFYTSGRTSNEAAYLYQLFVRQFGTNNLPDCSNMCHESSGTALSETIGIGKGTVTIDDFEKCDLILIIGQNPGTNHPRMMSSLEQAKKNGAKIISINPLPEAGLMNFVQPNPQEHSNPFTFPFKMLAGKGVALSDLHLPVRIGGDSALLKGILKLILKAEETEGNVLDEEFIHKKTANFNEFKTNLKKIEWQQITEQSGLTKQEIKKAADIFINSDRVITCWAMGITQHKEAVATIQEIVNLHLLRGQIGKEGAGLCPVRGHSNVQGDRTVGVWERAEDEFLDALEKEFNFDVPREHGFDAVNAIKAMYEGKGKVFFAMGGNFLSATPDTNYTAQALQNCDLTVQVITKLNRSALITGKKALILPPLGRSEIDVQANGAQFVTTENSMGVVQMSQGILKPASEHLRSEPWIVAELAKATFADGSTVDWDFLVANYDNIRDKIEKTIGGFENYNERVRKSGGFYLPNKPRIGEFSTPNKKANFTAHNLHSITLKPNEFILTSIRSHDQFNTTIYDLNDRYRGIKNERRVCFMNAEDMKEFDLKAGHVIDLTSHFEDGERFAPKFIVVPYSIPKRCLATYFPESNVLVPIGSVAKKSNTPTSKSTIVTISKNTENTETIGKFDYDFSSVEQ